MSQLPLVLPAVQFNTDLTALTTLALIGRAARLRVVRHDQHIEALLRAGDLAEPLWLLGGGSNVVVPEQVEGEVWQIANRGIRVVRETADARWVRAAAGESWHEFVRTCVQQGWHGLENLALIPGTVGAAPVQNIGAYGLEVAERIASVRAYHRGQQRWHELDAHDCQFGYRDSRFKREGGGQWIITDVTFRLPRDWQPRLTYPDLQRWPAWQQQAATPEAVFEAVCAIRQAKLPDPATLPNAGSFFKNPVVSSAVVAHWRDLGWQVPAWPQPAGGLKVAAAWLIEQAGWKGRRLGPVGMHDRHALVLVNHGGARGADVVALAHAVRTDVARRFGVVLEVEPVWLGVSAPAALTAAPPTPLAAQAR